MSEAKVIKAAALKQKADSGEGSAREKMKGTFMETRRKAISEVGSTTMALLMRNTPYTWITYYWFLSDACMTFEGLYSEGCN